jgi:hypothetical protein
MRIMILALIVTLASCAVGPRAPEPEGPSPFPVTRGEAPPPPPSAASGQSAPPEGAGPGGVDFGQWRGADPASYNPVFQAQMRARQAGRGEAQIRADLEANGFVCEQGRLDCRIEIMERQCAFDWYVVDAPTGLTAGFDIMCLGAR